MLPDWWNCVVDVLLLFSLFSLTVFEFAEQHHWEATLFVLHYRSNIRLGVVSKSWQCSAAQMNMKYCLLAVQTAKTICRESKNRNMMRRDIDAPIGKNIAWHVSIVCIPVGKQRYFTYSAFCRHKKTSPKMQIPEFCLKSPEEMLPS